MKTFKYLYRNNYSKAVHAAMMLKNHRTNRHIVVFESDDWGSIRTPSLAALERLKAKGLQSSGASSSYDNVDTLASNDDLELLMDTLSSINDFKGNPPIITFNCVTANPDFDAIRKSGFRQYFCEPFTETLKKYPHHNRSFELLKEGMCRKMFRPQFHGREHLNVPAWMRYLQSSKKEVLMAFDEKMFCLDVKDGDNYTSVLQAFDIRNSEDINFVSKSINEGLSMFERIFGFTSKTMIAPCYTWDSFVENEANNHGVIGIQTGYIQRHSYIEKEKGNRVTGHFFGELNKNGQVYTIRNCSFEPSQNSRLNSDSCLADIKKAFTQRVPAVVSCHRLNFIGELNPANRDVNLKDFRFLLREIIDAYPDVEFLSSDELASYYNNKCKWYDNL